jgi:hypothetical protein
MAMQRVLVASAAIAVLTLGGPRAAAAGGYATNRLDPSEAGSDWYTTESLDLRGALRPQVGVLGDWAYAPLVRHERTIIEDSITSYVRAAVVIADRLRLATSLPVVLYQHGDDAPAPSTVRAPSRPQAFGDLRLSGDFRLFGTYESKVRAAAGLAVHLPTGSRGAYTGDGTVRFTPRVLVAGDASYFVWAAKLGFALRPERGTFDGRALGDEVVFSVSAGVNVNDRFVLGPELHGAATATGKDAFASRGVSTELLLGSRVKLAHHYQIGSAIGGGILGGDGAPTLRVLLVFEYAPDVCVDTDGDGVCSYDDACPDRDGVRTNDRKTNGCPADRDRDRIPDRDDNCPDAPGDRTIDPATAGCPDRDRDGVADPADACPDVPGVPNTDAGRNGCPKVDEPPPPGAVAP